MKKRKTLAMSALPAKARASMKQEQIEVGYYKRVSAAVGSVKEEVAADPSSDWDAADDASCKSEFVEASSSSWVLNPPPAAYAPETPGTKPKSGPSQPLRKEDLPPRRPRPRGGLHKAYWGGYYKAKGKGKGALAAYVDRWGPPPRK